MQRQIKECKQIRDFLTDCKDDSFVVFDLDNTVMESIEELGSDQWFCTLMSEACRALQKSPDENVVALVLAIYNAVQHVTCMKAVEDEVIAIIKQLQDQNIPVLGLTARGKEIMIPTFKQLNANGIRFYRQWGTAKFDLSEGNGNEPVLFNQGVIFCSGGNKGVCLNAFFNALNYHPTRIIMIDDKVKHLEAVKSAIKGNFIGFRYGYLDKKVEQFEMQKADIQLTRVQHRFPKEADDAIKTLTHYGMFKTPQEDAASTLIQPPAKHLS